MCCYHEYENILQEEENMQIYRYSIEANKLDLSEVEYSNGYLYRNKPAFTKERRL